MMILPALILIPLAAAVAVALTRSDKAARYVALGASILETAVFLPLLALAPEPGLNGAQAGSPPFFLEFLRPWIPAWGISFHLAVDGISLVLLALTVAAAPLCVACSWSSIKERVKEFHICLLLMTAACVGVFTAMDLVLFYVFWEAMLIPMFLLIAVWGGEQRRYAAIKFFLYTLSGSVLLLAAFAALRYAGGVFSIPRLMVTPLDHGLQIWVFLALALAFAVKVPMFPLHSWLPAAHVQAPAAGSVILAAVLLKMGGYGFIRFCLPITPYGAETFAPLMIALSVCGIIYGGFLALAQTDVKKLVAYSSVAHMGFVTLGIFMFDAWGIQGAVLQMLNHGIITGSLFMLMGALYERGHSREIGDNLGVGKHMPVFMGLWILFSLASFGFPGTNGFVGEMMLFIAGFSRSLWIGAGMILGALLSAAYMLRVSIKLAWGRPVHGAGWKDLNKREICCFLAPAALVLILGFFSMPVLDLSRAATAFVQSRLQREPGRMEKMIHQLPLETQMAGTKSPPPGNSGNREELP